jgi:hypothetical protein
MLRDTLDVAIKSGTLLVILGSLYAIAMISKPEELELRKGQLGEWWTQISNNDSTGSRNPSPGSNPSSPEGTKKPGETWGF